MDYFNGNGMEESISINDMIECDMRCNFNEHLGGNGDSQSGFPGMGSILDYDINSLDMTDSKATLASLISMNGADLNWMNTLNLTSLQAFTKTENSDPNLMVNPQTGMPISCEQSMSTDTNAMLSAQTPNMNESAVREALLRRTPDPTTFIAVAPSQVQQPPQYIQQQIKQEPEPEQPTRQQQPQQQQSSNSQTIRQHLQAQVSHSLPSPQSPGSPYPDISSPQPMVVSSPQKSHPTPKSVVMTDVDKIYPKPVYSYSCLIAMALKNSDTGCLPVSEIYNFMTENFPYFKTAPDGWKNSVRHNLSLNKCFEKIENPKSTGTTKKGCLWAMNPAKIEKMEEEIAKWRKKDPIAIKRSMSRPEVLDLLEAGNGGCRSPHRLALQTSTNNNNNVTKPTTPITTSAPSEMRLSKMVTNISANVNVIEIKPVKVEQSAAAGAGGVTVKEELANLTPDELSVLDNNILDPAINDMAIQNGLFGAVMFDDFNGDELNLEDFQNGGSPLSFTLSSAGLTASPIHFNAGGASGTGNFIVTPNIDEKGAIQSGFNLFNCSVPSSAPSTPASKYTLARTVTAQT